MPWFSLPKLQKNSLPTISINFKLIGAYLAGAATYGTLAWLTGQTTPTSITRAMGRQGYASLAWFVDKTLKIAGWVAIGYGAYLYGKRQERNKIATAQEHTQSLVPRPLKKGSSQASDARFLPINEQEEEDEEEEFEVSVEDQSRPSRGQPVQKSSLPKAPLEPVPTLTFSQSKTSSASKSNESIQGSELPKGLMLSMPSKKKKTKTPKKTLKRKTEAEAPMGENKNKKAKKLSA